jgi:hypothetical protein
MKTVQFEDWSQRFSKHRRRKAVKELNEERELGIIFPILNVIRGLILIYVIAKLFFS